MRTQFVYLSLVVVLLCPYVSAQWVQTNGPCGGYVYCFAASGTHLFAGNEKGVFRSTDDGTSWIVVYSSLTSKPVQALAVIPDGLSGRSLFAGTFGDGVILSTDGGTNWTAVNSGLGNSRIYSLAVIHTNLFAGTFGGGVFRSTDDGTSWTIANTGLTGTDVRAFAVSPNGAGGASLFAGTEAGVFFSIDNGSRWTPVNSGLKNVDVRALAVSPDGAGGMNLFAGTIGSGVWRRPLVEFVASVQPSRGDLPNDLSLDQNFPNPFNPSTTITFKLPKSLEVTLSVFDMLGREVSLPVNERRDAGVHEVKFDGTNLASGVYFYRLRAGDFVETKRLLLLR